MTDDVPLVKTIPSFRLTTPAVDFIENRLPAVDPAFRRLDGRLDPFTEKFILKQDAINSVFPDSKEISEAKEAFMKTVQKVNERMAKKSKGDTGIQLDDGKEYSWEDVLKTLEDAHERYHAIDNGNISGWLHKAMRSTKNLKGPVESWARLLPSESWQGSLVCGGLKVLVGVAGQIGDFRDEIGETILQIPIIFSEIVELRKAYDTKMLTDYCTQLTVAALEAMTLCLQWLMRKPSKKVIGALARGKDYEKGFQDKLRRLRILRTAVADAGRMSLHNRVASEAQKDEASREVTAGTFELVKTMSGQVVSGLDILKSGLETLNNMKVMFEDETALKLWIKRTVEKDEAEVRELRASKQILTQDRKDDLLDHLRYDPEVALADQTACLQSGFALSRDDQSRTAYMLNAWEVKTWMTESASLDAPALVINAQEPGRDLTHSAASFFSAMLLTYLRDAHAVTTLRWFCQQHMHDDLRPMIVDLLGQLLLQGLREVDCFALPRPGELQYSYDSLLVALLHCIDLQLQEGPVFCILDSIGIYEDRRRGTDLVRMLRGMCEVAKDGKYPLKILATSITRSVLVGSSEAIKPLVLFVPEVVPDVLV